MHSSIIIDVLTLLAIAIGLGFTAIQTRQLRRSIDASNENTNYSNFKSVAEAWLDVDAMFVQHPAFRKYIYEGTIPPDRKHNEYDRCIAIGARMLDFIDYALPVLDALHASEYKSDELSRQEAENTWRPFFKQLFVTSLLLRELTLSNPQLYYKATLEMARNSSSG
jgi:hypothetical protein